MLLDLMYYLNGFEKFSVKIYKTKEITRAQYLPEICYLCKINFISLDKNGYSDAFLSLGFFHLYRL